MKSMCTVLHGRLHTRNQIPKQSDYTQCLICNKLLDVELPTPLFSAALAVKQVSLKQHPLNKSGCKMKNNH